jgi:hypothetical protein
MVRRRPPPSARAGGAAANAIQLRAARAPRVPPIQRMISGRTMARGLGTDQPIPALGTYVVQNQKKYICSGTAHTSNLATCSALAMYSRTTGLSFLFHVDDRTNPHALAGRIDCYVGAVNQGLGWGYDQKTLKAFYSNEVEIWIVSPQGNRDGSVRVARRALEIVTGDGLRHKVKLVEEEIGRDTRIVVGPNGVEVILTRAQKIARAYRLVLRNKTYENATALSGQIALASGVEWGDFAQGVPNVYALADLAKELDHAPLRSALEDQLGQSLADY